MNSTSSLQKNLSIGLTLGVTLLWAIAMLGAIFVSQDKLNQQFDSALAETAQRIMPLAVVEILNREDSQKPQQIMGFEAHEEHLVYLVRDQAGAILLQSHNANPAAFNQALKTGFSSSASHRFYGASAVRNTLFIEVAEPLAQRQEAIKAVAMTLLWPLIILIPFCFIGSWIFVRYSLRSVLAYQAAVETRGSGDLSAIKVDGLPLEFEVIADSVNSLLNRLRRALESERSFTANSAHELRTPIATGLAQVQRLQQEVPEDTVKQRLLKLEATLRGLSTLSEKLMQLAKAEGGGLLAREKHDLISLLKIVLDDLQRTYPDSNIVLTTPSVNPHQHSVFTSLIDQDAFAILIRNLVSNAIKHGVFNEPIEISFTSGGLLSVINASDVVPKEKLVQLRQRFVRSNNSVQGLGLGLAIVDAIVSGVGANMQLKSPASGRSDGFEVQIDFSSTEQE